MDSGDPMGDAAADLAGAVAARRDELVSLAQALIRIPTTNPPGHRYRDVCDLLAVRLAGSGFACGWLRAEGAPGDSDRSPRWTLWARREGSGPGPTVRFNGHPDVGAPGHGWSVDPFGCEVRDGRVYGRGACDMKGGIAAAVVAAEAFLARRPGFRGAVEISATADEETGAMAALPGRPRRGGSTRGGWTT